MVLFVLFLVIVILIMCYIVYLVLFGCVYGIILNYLSSIKYMYKFFGYDLIWDSDYCYILLLCGVKCYLGIVV